MEFAVLIFGRMPIMKVRICPDCGERWWCIRCGYCHLCYPDFEPPAGVAVTPLGGRPKLPSQAVHLLEVIENRPSSTKCYLEARTMKALKSGEKVPSSGIYRILHSTPHIPVQRELYFEGSRFRGCDDCPGGVFFQLESPCVPGLPRMSELATAIC